MRHAAPAGPLQVKEGGPRGLIPFRPAASMQCPLCGGGRRDYLFVVGQSRMTRCHECGLISRTGTDDRPVAPAPQASSYLLDAATDRSIRDQLAAAGLRNVLEVLVGSDDAALGPDPRLRVTRMSPGTAPPPGPFDAVFVNGAIEEVEDPVALLRSVRSVLKTGAALWVVASDGDLRRLPSDQAKLPCHVFSPATLIRLARQAGFRSEACGAMLKPMDVAARDDRLVFDRPFSRVHRLLRLFGRNSEVASGLMELRAVATDGPEQTRVSIVMPVFNEARTFRTTFSRIYGARIDGVSREVVVVESNSTDGTRELVREIESLPDVRVIYEDRPRGKGHGVRTGIAAATGDIILIQDADSEYDVGDYDIVLEPLLRLSTTFVLGSRHMGGRTWKVRQFNDFPLLGTHFIASLMNFAHLCFTTLANWMYDTEMRDPHTMYKVFRREAIAGIGFRRNRFDYDWELVCKLLRRGHLPVEVPVNYRARGYAEGKKIRMFRDPWTWIAAIVACRFENLR